MSEIIVLAAKKDGGIAGVVRLFNHPPDISLTAAVEMLKQALKQGLLQFEVMEETDIDWSSVDEEI
jgi:hypothetical protein